MRRWVASFVLFGTAGLLTTAGCNALLDIDHIDFGDGPTGGAGGGIGGTGGSSGTGGSTSSTSSGGGTGGDGGEGGEGGALAEDCTNGVDDNGDNQTDCADPLCSDHICVDQTIPQFWYGPVVLYRGSSAPNCGGTWPTLAEAGGAGMLWAPPASCTSCSCSSPQGTSCPPAEMAFWTNGTCTGGQAQTQTVATANTCEAITNATMGFSSAAGTAVVASGGSCQPSGGMAQVPSATFTDDALLCGGATAGAGCSDSEVCLPPPGGGFESAVCIYRSGNRTCSSPFTVKHTIYTSTTDSRTCSSCTCDPPQSVVCSGTTHLHVGMANTTCTGGSVAVPHGVGCVAVSSPGSMGFFPDSPSGGSCDAQGGSPTGAAQPDGQHTVCCTP